MYYVYRYIDEDEQLEIALAVSASLYNENDNNINNVQLPATKHIKQKKKKLKTKSKATIPTPLLLTSAEEANKRLMIRADYLLTHDNDEDDIPLTQVIAPSTLGIPTASVTTTIENSCRNDNVRDNEQHDNEQHVVVTAGSERDPVTSDSVMSGCLIGGMTPVTNYRTMWQLSAYVEDEPMDEFYVEMLKERVPHQVQYVYVTCIPL